MHFHENAHAMSSRHPLTCRHDTLWQASWRPPCPSPPLPTDHRARHLRHASLSLAAANTKATRASRLRHPAACPPSRLLIRKQWILSRAVSASVDTLLRGGAVTVPFCVKERKWFHLRRFFAWGHFSSLLTTFSRPLDRLSTYLSSHNLFTVFSLSSLRLCPPFHYFPLPCPFLCTNNVPK